MDLWGLPAYPVQPNSEYRVCKRRSETTGDKLRGREGNSPDRQLRSQNYAKLKGSENTKTARMLA